MRRVDRIVRSLRQMKNLRLQLADARGYSEFGPSVLAQARIKRHTKLDARVEQLLDKCDEVELAELELIAAAGHAELRQYLEVRAINRRLQKESLREALEDIQQEMFGGR